MSNLDKANSVAHEWVESMGGLEAIRHNHDSDLSGLMQALDDAGLLTAAAPEHTQALAEETWEYGVTYIGVKHGGHHIEWVESTGDAEWDKDTLQLLVKRWKRKGQSPKIVRRRVSPPEVINE